MPFRDTFHGSEALLIRGLNEDARSLGMHLVRAVFVGLALFGCLSFFFQQGVFGAPGLAAFRLMIYVDAIGFALIGVSYFSAAIAEEREQGMLGLLKMSGISPLGLLLGKSTLRLLPACMGLILQVPLILLAITLGGVRYEQIAAAVCALLAFLVLLVNLSLFMSVISPTPQIAGQRTWAALVFMFFLPIILGLPASLLPAGVQPWENSGIVADICSGLQSWFRDRHIATRIRVITDSTFDQSWLSSQVTFDLALGVILFLISWWSFESFTRDRDLSIERRPDGKKIRKLSRGISLRSWDNAFAWKEFQFSIGGWRALRRTLFSSLLVLSLIFCFCYGLLLYGTTSQFGAQITTLSDLIREFGPIPLLGSLLLIGITIVGGFGRSFAADLKEKTFGTLMLTPQTPLRIVSSTVLGRLMPILPLGLVLFLGIAWTLGTDNWLIRTPISSLNNWLILCLYPPCILVAVLDAGIWFFYLGLWRNSVGNAILAASSTIFLFYASIAALGGVFYVSGLGNPLTTALASLGRILVSLILWRIVWERIKIVLRSRMAD
ncbi:MAG: hypothetical protein U0903_16185 [Planctomycetales bacterium]